MGLRNTDIIPQRSSSVLTSGSIPSHRNIHVLIALLVLNCSGQPFWDPQLLSVILGKHKQTLSPKPIESAPLSPDSVPHCLSGVLQHCQHWWAMISIPLWQSDSPAQIPALDILYLCKSTLIKQHISIPCKFSLISGNRTSQQGESNLSPNPRTEGPSICGCLPL